MASVRTVKKALLCMEDVTQGVGIETQNRGGDEIQVHKVDFPFAVSTEVELKALSTTRWNRANVYYDTANPRLYIFDSTATSGDIQPDVGIGFWILAKNTYNLTLTEMVEAKYLRLGDVVIVSDRGYGRFEITTGGVADTFSIIQLTGTSFQAKLVVLNGKVHIEQFGADSTGVVESTGSAQAWIDFIITNSFEGILNSGVYLIDFVSAAANNGVRISGGGIFKATGSNRMNLFRLTQVRGKVEINGPTFDANNIAARALEIQNTGSTPTTQGEVYIGELTRCINAKNNAPDTFSVFGCYVFGGFTNVTFEGEVDGVDSSSTSGASTAGFLTTFQGSGDDWVKSTLMTGKARIRNVKNDNTVLADADGMRAGSPTDKIASLTIEPGALFEECKGRAIKSQVVKNAIIGPVINRSLFDGLTEIALQFSGGKVLGAQVFHDGTRVNSVVGITLRADPLNTQSTVSNNELTVIGTPSSSTDIMVDVVVNDATVKNQGVRIRDNKVKGAVDFMIGGRVANVADVNRMVIDGNWAETINTAYLSMTLFGSARAQLTVVFTNNGCQNGCTGGSLTNDLKVEQDYNNFNITPLLSSPFTYTITTGIVTPKGEKVIRVIAESGTTDDVDTIVMTNYSPDEILTVINNSSSNTITYKDGVGNLKLAGDAILSSINDTIQFRFDGTNVCEVSRSINGV